MLRHPIFSHFNLVSSSEAYRNCSSVKLTAHRIVTQAKLNIPAWMCGSSSQLFCSTGVLQLMEIGDVYRKDIIDHPENYTLLTTLDEGLSHNVFSWHAQWCSVVYYSAVFLNWWVAELFRSGCGFVGSPLPQMLGIYFPDTKFNRII